MEYNECHICYIKDKLMQFKKISVTYQINKLLNPNCSIFFFCSTYLNVMTTDRTTRVRREIVIILSVIPGGHRLAD